MFGLQLCVMRFLSRDQVQRPGGEGGSRARGHLQQVRRCQLIGQLRDTKIKAQPVFQELLLRLHGGRSLHQRSDDEVSDAGEYGR